jgi:predicted permease
LPSSFIVLHSENSLNNQLLFPIGVAWIGFAVCLCFSFRKEVWLVKKLTGCLILTAGLEHVPWFSIIEALYGQEGMKTAILVDQPELCSTFYLGILVATMYSKGEPNGIQILKK